MMENCVTCYIYINLIIGFAFFIGVISMFLWMVSEMNQNRRDIESKIREQQDILEKIYKEVREFNYKRDR